MTKEAGLTFEQLNAVISYDPSTGRMTWRIDVSKNVKAGVEVGSVKTIRKNKSGEAVRYRYIRYAGAEIPAARAAWFLHFKEWPARNIHFRDGDPLNLRIENLGQAKLPASRVVVTGDRRSYRMSKEAQRHYGLRRYYGMTGEQYGEMLAAQKGLCAICQKPETAMFNGVPKVLHVDHCHAGGGIRALLCGSCNGMLGLAKDSPATLRAAADYLEAHKADDVPINTSEAA